MTHSYKVGDWVMYEGQVCQLLEIDGNSVSVGDARWECGTQLQTVFPLTLANKGDGELIMLYEKRARYGDPRGEYSSNLVNHPGVHAAFVALHNQCLSLREEMRTARDVVLRQARDLSHAIRVHLRDAAQIEVGGVRIYSQQRW